MDYKQIELLLERYWQCDTSLEEEATLRDFFMNEEVPAHLIQFKELFVYQSAQQEIGLDDSFDQRVLELIEVPVVKAKQITFIGRLMPLFKAAAVVVFFVMIGNAVKHTMLADRMNDYNYENYIDTYDNPEAAYQQVSSALMMISESINKSKQLQAVDSLQFDQVERMIE